MKRNRTLRLEKLVSRRVFAESDSLVDIVELCDMNADGRVEVLDAMVLINAVSKGSDFSNLPGGDLNADGRVTEVDSALQLSLIDELFETGGTTSFAEKGQIFYQFSQPNAGQVSTQRAYESGGAGPAVVPGTGVPSDNPYAKYSLVAGAYHCANDAPLSSGVREEPRSNPAGKGYTHTSVPFTEVDIIAASYDRPTDYPVVDDTALASVKFTYVRQTLAVSVAKSMDNLDANPSRVARFPYVETIAKEENNSTHHETITGTQASAVAKSTWRTVDWQGDLSFDKKWIDGVDFSSKGGETLQFTKTLELDACEAASFVKGEVITEIGYAYFEWRDTVGVGLEYVLAGTGVLSLKQTSIGEAYSANSVVVPLIRSDNGRTERWVKVLSGHGRVQSPFLGTYPPGVS